MRINKDVRRAVCFIGVGLGDDFTPQATGFMVAHDGFLHLVTAKHVAVKFLDAPFTVRFNAVGGGAVFAYFDPAEQVVPWRWCFHEDDNVDAAVALAPFDIDENRINCRPLGSELFHRAAAPEQLVEAGDRTYTVGLFRRLHGRYQNFIVTHSGHVAAVPEDGFVPVEDWDGGQEPREIGAYLVEQTSLSGLSGAPVFARTSDAIHGIPTDNGNKDILASLDRFYLLGLWQGAWSAPPDEVLRAEMHGGARVPVGMGVVVPANDILGILEMPEIKADRDACRRLEVEDDLPKPDFAAPISQGDAILGKMLKTPPKPK